ncbi:MAG: peptide deformylase [Alphaproteobacteria bacterium]|nr:peptide deformylase [Alphaproteobacteria bacterium]
MALLKIARMGHPVLGTRADEVGNPAAPEIARLIGDMIETMGDAGGVGLAAPQVHVPLRVVILGVPAARLAAENDEEDAPRPIPLTAMINPVIETIGDEHAEDWEACLSVPGMIGLVPRHTHIRFTYQSLDDETVDFEARDFHARVIQHECDHLDGILYPQRIHDLTKFGFAEEINRARRAAENAHEDAEETEEEIIAAND